MHVRPGAGDNVSARERLRDFLCLWEIRRIVVERETRACVVEQADPRRAQGGRMSSTTQPETKSAQTYIDQQDVRENMTCGTCTCMLWDCACPQKVECMHCQLDQEDAKWLDAKAETYICPGSSDGLHVFVSVDKEP